LILDATEEEMEKAELDAALAAISAQEAKDKAN
jgi:hypothetical protein